MERTVVFQSFNPAEAEVIRGRLEAAGIPASVRNEESALAGGAGIAGVTLMVDVRSEQAEEARQLIDSPESVP